MNRVLAHYGVKGMRWGVRKSRPSSGTRKTASKKPTPKPSATKKSRLSDLSDDELRRRINRLNMEKQYRDLTAHKDGVFVTRGKQVVANILFGTAEDIGKAYLKKRIGVDLLGLETGGKKKKKNDGD